jgi:RsiW-degrading membrane proteinase PrsW (M82 family)
MFFSFSQAAMDEVVFTALLGGTLTHFHQLNNFTFLFELRQRARPN